MRSTSVLSRFVPDGAESRWMNLLPAVFFTTAVMLGMTLPGNAQDELPFKRAQIRIEVNSTDGDAGLQLDLDADPWRMLQIENPQGRLIFSVKSLGKLKTLGNTELFTESNEPSFDELPIKDFLKMFPEGDYEFEGITVEGLELESIAVLTHDMPCGPELLFPTEGDVLDPNAPVVIDWEPVQSKLDKTTGECDESSEIEIAGYQIIVVREDPLPQIKYTVDVPAAVTEITVSPEFIEPGAVYTYEVLSKEPGGNQTISEDAFETSN